MPLSPLVSNWFHKLQPPELRGLFQTSPGVPNRFAQDPTEASPH